MIEIYDKLKLKYESIEGCYKNIYYVKYEKLYFVVSNNLTIIPSIKSKLYNGESWNIEKEIDEIEFKLYLKNNDNFLCMDKNIHRYIDILLKDKIRFYKIKEIL